MEFVFKTTGRVLGAWSSVFVMGLGSFGMALCPSIQGDQDIQSQFQWVQHAGTHLSMEQASKLQQTLEDNKEVLRNFSCFFQKGSDPNSVGEVLSALKLQILQLRLRAHQKEKDSVAQALLGLRRMSGAYLGQPSQMARRLGASVRSLLLDELERLMDEYPELVKQEVQMGIWRSDLSSGIESEVLSQWKILKLQIPKSATSTSLSRYFGFRPWKQATSYRSRLARLISRFKMEETETLEGQLHVLFKLNPLNLSLTETDQAIRHYLNLSLRQIKSNNYFILKPWLDPVIEEKIKTLKSELGVSWSLIAPLVGVQMEGPFQEIDTPIELLDSTRLAQAKTHYARTRNPLGRLYEIVFLKRLTQMWTQVDVVQLQSDLNRVSFFKTLLAVQDFQKRYSRWPSSVDELVTRKIITEAPRDYFTGKALQYDSKERHIWSSGENGRDEKGLGDDLSLKLSL